MKKYLSCIILIILCVVCATIFYVNAMDFNGNDKSDQSSTVTSTEESDAPSQPEPIITINKSGTFLSERLTDCNLRVEWAIYKLENEPTLYVGIELYLDTPEQITNAGKGYLVVNGEKKEFSTKTMVGTTNLLCSHSLSMEYTGKTELNVSAFLDITSKTVNQDIINGLTVSGKIIASEEQQNVPNKYIIDLNHISKFPELPSGDEITSLCMVLNYMKYNIDKCDLSDLYLNKGPSYHTNIFEANAGNPKDTYNSFGCMPPVIVNAANKYISINGGNAYAQDISGVSTHTLYEEVSKGNPIIVWACEDFNNTPSVFRTLVIDGKTIYLKSNVNTMVLIGYDYENKTVTLADPSGVVFDIEMELFEQRFSQVGSYAVIIK